jgi:DNA-binding transcriptional MerR regulator
MSLEKKELLTIGELSKLSGLPISTIRYYCDREILTPEYVGGLRMFRREEAMQKIARIRELKERGFKLTQIKEILKEEG